jgi:hypothetical protein
LFAATLFVVATGSSSQAAMLVIDTSNLAQAQKEVAALQSQLETAKSQLSTLKQSLQVATDQLNKLKEMKSVADDTLSSIGEMGNISIPSINFDSLASSIASAKSCLVPDYKSLMPSINTDNMSFGSICDRTTAYSSGLITRKESLQTGSWEEKKEVLKGISTNRVNTITDASVKGLAEADQAIETADETLETAQDYKQAGEGAADMNARLQVLIEVSVAQLTAQTHTNQLLAQLLKVQSAAAISEHVPVENDLAEESDSDGD